MKSEFNLLRGFSDQARGHPQQLSPTSTYQPPQVDLNLEINHHQNVGHHHDPSRSNLKLEIEPTGFFAIFPDLTNENKMRSFDDMWYAADMLYRHEKDMEGFKEHLDTQDWAFVRKGAWKP